MIIRDVRVALERMRDSVVQGRERDDENGDKCAQDKSHEDNTWKKLINESCKNINSQKRRRRTKRTDAIDENDHDASKDAHACCDEHDDPERYIKD